MKGHPEYKVFIDGRADMYGGNFPEEHKEISGMKHGFEDVLEKYGATWIIYEANAPLCRFLKASGKWHLVYADRVANALLKDVEQNRELIDKYRNVRFLQKRWSVVE